VKGRNTDNQIARKANARAVLAKMMERGRRAAASLIDVGQ
jgi:hypothetical protein